MEDVILNVHKANKALVVRLHY